MKFRFVCEECLPIFRLTTPPVARTRTEAPVIKCPLLDTIVITSESVLDNAPQVMHHKILPVSIYNNSADPVDAACSTWAQQRKPRTGLSDMEGTDTGDRSERRIPLPRVVTSIDASPRVTHLSLGIRNSRLTWANSAISWPSHHGGDSCGREVPDQSGRDVLERRTLTFDPPGIRAMRLGHRERSRLNRRSREEARPAASSKASLDVMRSSSCPSAFAFCTSPSLIDAKKTRRKPSEQWVTL